MYALYQFTVVEPTGDFDGDDAVDGSDFLTWQRGLDNGKYLRDGVADGSGVVDGVDLALWQQQFGQRSLIAVAVPEPSGVVLIVWGMAAAQFGRVYERR